MYVVYFFVSPLRRYGLCTIVYDMPSHNHIVVIISRTPQCSGSQVWGFKRGEEQNGYTDLSIQILLRSLTSYVPSELRLIDACVLIVTRTSSF